MQIRGACNCTTYDWLGCTIVQFVTQLVKTYTLYVFFAAVWGRLGLPSFFDRNFFWFSLFMYSRVELKINCQTCSRFVVCLLFVICFISLAISKPRLFPIKFKFNIQSATLLLEILVRHVSVGFGVQVAAKLQLLYWDTKRTIVHDFDQKIL